MRGPPVLERRHAAETARASQDFFIASFAIGVGGTGWTLQGEVFPMAVRGQAAAFAAMIGWLANCALIEVFPVTQNAISLAGVMVVFAGLCALAIVFIWKFLPETKGLPVEEIVQVFERQQKESALSTAAPSGQLRREKAELAMRCDVLKRSVASGSGCEGRQVASVGLIAPQGADHGIPQAVSCRALDVNQSWYFTSAAW